MLSASTARLVDGAAALGRPEMVRIKGAEEPAPAHRLLGMGEQHRAVGRVESNLVGRQWEMATAEGLLQRAVDGHGAVVLESWRYAALTLRSWPPCARQRRTGTKAGGCRTHRSTGPSRTK